MEEYIGQNGEAGIMDVMGEGCTIEGISVKACKGSPVNIRPGSVVAMAEALETLVNWYTINDPEGCYYGESHPVTKARKALDMYYGVDTSSE